EVVVRGNNGERRFSWRRCWRVCRLRRVRRQPALAADDPRVLGITIAGGGTEQLRTALEECVVERIHNVQPGFAVGRAVEDELDQRAGCGGATAGTVGLGRPGVFAVSVQSIRADVVLYPAGWRPIWV